MHVAARVVDATFSATTCAALLLGSAALAYATEGPAACLEDPSTPNAMAVVRARRFAPSFAGVGIPCIVHRVLVRTGARGEEAADTATPAWAALMPRCAHVAWNNSAIRGLIGECVGAAMLRVYDQYPLDIHRSDAARYILMHCVGGFYRDGDIVLHRALPEAWFESDDVRLLLSARVGSKEVVQSFFGSAPGHPFWSLVVGALPRTARWWDALEVAGPSFFLRAYRIAVCLRMRYVHLNGSMTQYAKHGRVRGPGVYATHELKSTWTDNYYAFLASRCAVSASEPSAECSQAELQQLHRSNTVHLGSEVRERSPACILRCLERHQLSPQPDRALHSTRRERERALMLGQFSKEVFKRLRRCSGRDGISPWRVPVRRGTRIFEQQADFGPPDARWGWFINGSCAHNRTTANATTAARNSSTRRRSHKLLGQ